MTDTLKREYSIFLGKLVLLALIVLGVYAVAHYGLSFPLPLSSFISLLLFFLVLSAVLHYLLLNLSRKRPQQFVNSFMGITGGKLFTLLIVLMIYLGVNKDIDRVSFIIAFFFLYIIFTTFEIISLLKASRNNNRR